MIVTEERLPDRVLELMVFSLKDGGDPGNSC
jgi:hypothetical protein